MMEQAVFDENGQLLTGAYTDYAMPRAADVPMLTVDHACNTPCTHNPLGVKGCGEAGAIGSPPALVNAVIDALTPYGITHIDMPLTPRAVWEAIRKASPAVAAE
jgi:carbon-monoxide dehydrogenase large subunit